MGLWCSKPFLFKSKTNKPRFVRIEFNLIAQQLCNQATAFNLASYLIHGGYLKKIMKEP